MNGASSQAFAIHPSRDESLGAWRERTGGVLVSVALRSGGLADVLERGRLRLRARALPVPLPPVQAERVVLLDLAALVAGLDPGEAFVLAVSRGRGDLLTDWAGNLRSWVGGCRGKVAGRMGLDGYGVGVSS